MAQTARRGMPYAFGKTLAQMPNSRGIMCSAQTKLQPQLQETACIGQFHMHTNSLDILKSLNGGGKYHRQNGQEKDAPPVRMPLQPHAMETNPTANHVWTEKEIKRLVGPEGEKPHYEPQNTGDWMAWGAVRAAYHSFNFVTRYRSHDPSPASVARRVLILESVAGVPGMVAAMSRHFRSLRAMERDNGWIQTLLEEAENERMHLLTFMQVFKPSLPVRLTVLAAQYTLAPALLAVYAVRPSLMHRFVGYLEETAVHTYSDIIHWMNTPGSQLNKAWSEIPAPDLAKGYWNLPDSASLLDVVEQIAADETHHRDVNHCLANLSPDEPNPFLAKARANSFDAWRRLCGITAVDSDGDQRIDTIAVDSKGTGKADIIFRDTTGDSRLDTVYFDVNGTGKYDKKISIAEVHKWAVKKDQVVSA